MFPLEVAPLATGSFALRMEKVTAQKMAAKQKAKIGPSCTSNLSEMLHACVHSRNSCAHEATRSTCGKVHHRSFQ